MIEDLTKDKLKKYGFRSGEIKSILNDTDSDIIKYKGFDFYIVSCAEQKIYSGKDATKKQLIKEGKNLPLIGIGTFKEDYFLREKSYIDKHKEIVKENFNINIAKNKFRNNEIRITKERIEEKKKITKHLPSVGIINNLNNQILNLEYHLSWLEQLPTAQPPATTDQPKTETKATSKDEPETRTLKELFKFPHTYDNCLKLLREKEIINIDNEIMSGIDKGSLLVWFRALERNGLLTEKSIFSEQMRLLNETFKNLNIKISTVKKKGGNIKADASYRADFDSYFNDVRLINK